MTPDGAFAPSKTFSVPRLLLTTALFAEPTVRYGISIHGEGDTRLHSQPTSLTQAARRKLRGTIIMKAELTAIVKQDGDWWIGWIEEVPGANAQKSKT